MTGAEIAETLAMPVSTVSGILTRIADHVVVLAKGTACATRVVSACVAVAVWWNRDTLVGRRLSPYYSVSRVGLIPSGPTRHPFLEAGLVDDVPADLGARAARRHRPRGLALVVATTGQVEIPLKVALLAH